METHKSNDCADEILRLIKKYHESGKLISLHMSRHDIFERTLYLWRFENVRLTVGGKTHHLSNCPISEIYEFPIFEKLKNNGYKMKYEYLPTKYMEHECEVERFPSKYVYYNITESSLKPVYDAYNKLTTFIKNYI